jgi:hypothetical protein
MHVTLLEEQQDLWELLSLNRKLLLNYTICEFHLKLEDIHKTSGS